MVPLWRHWTDTRKAVSTQFLGTRQIPACLLQQATTLWCGCMGFPIFPPTKRFYWLIDFLVGHERVPMKAALGKADFQHKPNIREQVLFDQQRAFVETNTSIRVSWPLGKSERRDNRFWWRLECWASNWRLLLYVFLCLSLSLFFSFWHEFIFLYKSE